MSIELSEILIAVNILIFGVMCSLVILQMATLGKRFGAAVASEELLPSVFSHVCN